MERRRAGALKAPLQRCTRSIRLQSPRQCRCLNIRSALQTRAKTTTIGTKLAVPKPVNLPSIKKARISRCFFAAVAVARLPRFRPLTARDAVAVANRSMPETTRLPSWCLPRALVAGPRTKRRNRLLPRRNRPRSPQARLASCCALDDACNSIHYETA